MQAFRAAVSGAGVSNAALQGMVLLNLERGGEMGAGQLCHTSGKDERSAKSVYSLVLRLCYLLYNNRIFQCQKSQHDIIF